MQEGSPRSPFVHQEMRGLFPRGQLQLLLERILRSTTGSCSRWKAFAFLLLLSRSKIKVFDSYFLMIFFYFIVMLLAFISMETGLERQFLAMCKLQLGVTHADFCCWMLAESYKMKAQYKRERMDKRRRSRHSRGHEHPSFLEKVLDIFCFSSALLPSFSRPVLGPGLLSITVVSVR